MGHRASSATLRNDWGGKKTVTLWAVGTLRCKVLRHHTVLPFRYMDFKSALFFFCFTGSKPMIVEINIFWILRNDPSSNILKAGSNKLTGFKFKTPVCCLFQHHGLFLSCHNYSAGWLLCLHLVGGLLSRHLHHEQHQTMIYRWGLLLKYQKQHIR